MFYTNRLFNVMITSLPFIDIILSSVLICVRSSSVPEDLVPVTTTFISTSHATETTLSPTDTSIMTMTVIRTVEQMVTLNVFETSTFMECDRYKEKFGF